MFEIVLFVEDYGHETVIRTLVSRLASQYGVPVQVQGYSASGGHGEVIRQLKQFASELERSGEPFPGLLIVATDGNCKGFSERKKEIDRAMGQFTGNVAYAIPDPHVERWLLLDQAAFKKVLGKPCQAPDQKCERDRYKRSLARDVRLAGPVPELGGMEHAEEIVQAMDLERVEQIDASLGRFLKELRSHFTQQQP